LNLRFTVPTTPAATSSPRSHTTFLLLPEDTSPGAAIVNETFVKTFFRSQDPIGHTFERGTNPANVPSRY
jgi:hypothetical protein